MVAGRRYYTASPDGITVVRESSGTVHYELTDAHGTATTLVNQSTLAYQVRYFDPYGNQLAGTGQSAWADQHAYLGQPQDPATGLDRTRTSAGMTSPRATTPTVAPTGHASPTPTDTPTTRLLAPARRAGGTEGRDREQHPSRAGVPAGKEQAAAEAQAAACHGWRCFLKRAARFAAGVSTWASYASFLPVVGEWATALSVTAGAISSGLYLSAGDYQDAGSEALGTVLSVAAGGFGKLPGESNLATAWEGASSHIGGLPVVEHVGGNVLRTGLETGGRKAIVTPTYSVIKWETTSGEARAFSAYATVYGNHGNFDPIRGDLSYRFN